MYNDIVKLLESLTYSVEPYTDDFLINFLITKNTNYTLKSCNISEIPEDLTPKLVERIAGEFLLYKKDSGQLGETFDLDTAIKSIKEGDTQVNFAIGEGSVTPEKRLDNLITALMNNYERYLSRYRCIQW